MTKPLVIQTEELDADAAAWLGERCELVRCAVTDGRFAAYVARAEGLVVRTYTTVDVAMLEHASRLRVIGRAGVGLDSIDVAACRARGVEVVHTPEANTRAVVEFVFAALFAALRPLAFADHAMSLEEWNRVRRGVRARRQLSELTLGVLGLGRIGSRVARAGVGMGMKVIYNDLLEFDPSIRQGAEPVSLHSLLSESDIVTVHADPRPANRHLLSAPQFAAMRPDAVLVNAARGMMVDAAALGAHLRSNPRAVAIIDVHDPEPFGADYPLLGLPNARLTPHLAASTEVAQRNMSWVVRDVWRVLAGETPEFPAP